MTTVAEALAGELVGWWGLPRSYDERALRGEIAAEWTFRERAGHRIGRSFGILRASLAAPPVVVEAWIPTGGTAISSLEYRPPEGIEHAAVIADFGEPELLLRSRAYERGSLVRDRAYPARGTTLSVAEPFADEQGHADPPYVVFVQLYEATSTTAFVTTIGQHGEEIRPHPLP
ncbi:MAG TPA: hypothetical protein VNV42_06685 [Solirubrobacteraceae bacterium]|jgi:hypothetical protein|nr:hypothetical protein [Solirubrobacteraceae bacterium]